MRKDKISLIKRYRLIGLVASLVIFVIALLELTNTTHIFHKQNIPPVIPAHSNSGAPINNSGSAASDSTSGSASSGSSSNTQLPSDTSEHTLIAPFGNFISNHFPGQNGSPTAEASVCNTSPGATCYIKFTNTDTNQTTQLPSQVADSRGSTSWYWDTSQDAHLTSGKWQITAVATLGNQTKSVNDTLELTIQ